MIPGLDSFLAELTRLGKSMERLGRSLAAPTGKRKAGRRRRAFWTRKELQLIRQLYPGMRTDDLAKHLGRTTCAVYGAANVMGLHKSKAYLKSGLPDINKKANAGCFRKGQTSWNKGRKGYSAPGSEKGWFKKGRKPLNTWKPIGTETVTKDGYLVRKVTDVGGYNNDDWKFVHHLVWEPVHGPVPKGHVLGFRNGDKRDFRIENLVLRSFAENMSLNTFHRYPQPIKDIIHMRAVLTRAINKRKKNEND